MAVIMVAMAMVMMVITKDGVDDFDSVDGECFWRQ